MDTEIRKCPKCGALLPDKTKTCWNCERVKRDSGSTKSSNWRDSLKTLIKVIGFICILYLVGIILDPLVDSSKKNNNKNINFEWQGIVIPERYGYLGGLLRFDTLEIHEKYFLINKHEVLSNETITIPLIKAKRVIFGTFLGQKYIKIEYEGGFFGDSYKIYTNSNASSEYIRPFFNNNRIIIEDNWK